MAKHIFDETGAFDPRDVQERDIVFVQSDKLEEYFTQLHPQIQNPYKLITHNSDRNITNVDLRFIDEKIIRWFAQNVMARHEKLTPIPIGLENKKLAYAGIPWVFRRLSRKSVQTQNTKADRINRVLVGFNTTTNPTEREHAMAILEKNSLVEKLPSWPNQYKYAQILSKYNFVASPPGNGNDCIRTWEALYVGAIPIVKMSEGIKSFQQLGLPIYIIDDWQELNGLNERSLSGLYNSIMAKSDRSALSMDYWLEKIKKA
jgi:hypothetical protein